MQFLAGFESHRLARRYGHLGAGTRVAPNTGFAWANVEDAKAAQFDPVAGRERLFEAFEDCVYRRLGFVSRKASPLNNIVDDVLLDQRALLGKSAGSSVHPKPMLESLEAIVNESILP
jgi:hypothetical protein